MFIIKTNSQQEMADVAVRMMLASMLESESRRNICITAGSSPKRVYETLIPYVKDNPGLSHVRYFNFDEIPFKKSDVKGITVRDLTNLFYEPANIPKDQIYELNEKNYTTHDAYLETIGGIDFVLLGLGTDGHFCGNLPNTTRFIDETVHVHCTPDLKKRISGHFDDASEIPDYWITMGPKAIMRIKKLVMIVCGEHKAAAVKRLIEGDIDINFPSSILKNHPDFTLILDDKAASLLK